MLWKGWLRGFLLDRGSGLWARLYTGLGLSGARRGVGV